MRPRHTGQRPPNGLLADDGLTGVGEPSGKLVLRDRGVVVKPRTEQAFALGRDPAWIDAGAGLALDGPCLPLAAEPPVERRDTDGKPGRYVRDGGVAALVGLDGAAAEVCRDRHGKGGAAKLPCQNYRVTL